ncbi:MAG: helix-turn-helix domain-containing protein [Deltaproteobacteria bacterium]|nr:helix-turn-helix domain-containing protein [Deltaproteobacteria bacterium]
MTQVEFAEVLGITQGTVNKYERELIFPSEDILNKITDYGKVKIEWLLHGEAKPRVQEEVERLEKPIPGALGPPGYFAAVDSTVLAQILGSIETTLKKERRELSPTRKAHLVSILYDQFQETGQVPDRQTIREVLSSRLFR